jgi:hypothetical protein
VSQKSDESQENEGSEETKVPAPPASSTVAKAKVKPEEVGQAVEKAKARNKPPKQDDDDDNPPPSPVEDFTGGMMRVFPLFD